MAKEKRKITVIDNTGSNLMIRGAVDDACLNLNPQGCFAQRMNQHSDYSDEYDETNVNILPCM